MTFREHDDKAQVDRVLKSSNARGLLFSPQTNITNQEKRVDVAHELIPELEGLYLGDELSSSAYPSLKHVIQLSFTTIRGTTKFRDHMVYAIPSNTTMRLPSISPSDNLYQIYNNGSV